MFYFFLFKKKKKKKKNPVPFKLQEGEVRIISLEQCQSYFDMKTITNRMICAGYESGTVDSCMVSCLCLPKRFNSAIGSVGPYKLIIIHVWLFGKVFLKITYQMFPESLLNTF